MQNTYTLVIFTVRGTDDSIVFGIVANSLSTR